jgi:hypothetical protein
MPVEGARTAMKLCALELAEFTKLLFFRCFVNQEVQGPTHRILFYRAVPFSSISLTQPVEQLCILLLRKRLDLGLDLFEGLQNEPLVFRG